MILPYKDSEKARESGRKWRKENPEKAKESSRKAGRKYRKKNLEKVRKAEKPSRKPIQICI